MKKAKSFTAKRILAALLTAALVLTATAIAPVFADSGFELWDDYGYGVRSQIDRITADGADIAGGSPGDYLSKNKYTVAGVYDTLTFEGWAGYDQIVMAVGYALDGGENVLTGTTTPAEEGSHAATYGGDNAFYYSIDVPVTGIKEKTRISLIAKLEDDTVVALHRFDVFIQEKAEKIKKKDVALTQGGTGTPICFSDYGEVAFKIHIEEQWRLGQFVVVNSPTWDMVGAGLKAEIFKWDTDYGKTQSGKPLGTCYIEDHINCTSMVLELGYIPEGDYLIILSDFELKIGGYDATGPVASQKDTFKYFVDGYETDTGIPQLMMVLYDNTEPPEITAAPATEEPATEVPATAEPATEVPATDVPATAQPTDKPVSEPTAATMTDPGDNMEKTDGGNKALPIILGVIGGVAVIAGVIIAVVASKKKKAGK